MAVGVIPVINGHQPGFPRV